MNDAAAKRARSGSPSVWEELVQDIVRPIRSMFNVLDDTMAMLNWRNRKELQLALGRLGWRRVDGDLWRHVRSGVTMGFLDAVVMELHTAAQEKNIFEGHAFKKP